jgi:Chaperone of endosialidase
MARYNSAVTVDSISSLTTLTTPSQGVLTEFTGTGGFTVYLPNPTFYSGYAQAFYNASSGTVTLSLVGVAGNIVGPGTGGTTTQSMATGTTITMYSDGSNWVVTSFSGGGIVATTLSASSTVTLNPSSANVTISPTGTGTVTISPATTGSISNMTGSFTTLSASSTVSGSGFTTLFSSPSAIGNTVANSGAFTTLSASSTVSGSGFSTYLASPPAIGGSSAAAGTFTTLSCTSFTETSSITFKENVVPLENPLESVIKLVGVKYDRKDGSQKNEPGLIAEDVYKIIPELVQLKDGKPFGIHYTKLTAYLVECIKTLQTEIDELKKPKKTLFFWNKKSSDKSKK